MNKINWKVRIQNKAFWISFVPAILLLLQMVAGMLGYQLELGDLGDKLLGIINAVFAVLASLGIVTDPTTKGLSDSVRAMGYTEPN